MFSFLYGRKTYLVAAATFILGGLSALGVSVPPWVYPLLAAAGLGSLRAGVQKTAYDSDLDEKNPRRE